MAYMLFAFDNYYPSGGMNDWKATFSDVKDFEIWNIDSLDVNYDRYQIFDTYNGNKSDFNMNKKIQELEEIDPIPWDKEETIRKKLLLKFISEFTNEE